jgi:hypothetical protein
VCLLEHGSSTVHELASTPALKPVSPTAIAKIRALAHTFVPGWSVTIPADLETAAQRLTELCGTVGYYGIPPASPLPLHTFLAELCFSAVNFCYWTGGCDRRPDGVSSADARRIIFAAFSLSPYPSPTECAEPQRSREELIRSIEIARDALTLSQFPLSRARGHLLDEVRLNYNAAVELWRRCSTDDAVPDRDLDFLLSSFPGFARDPFAKRACLFFCLLERVYGRCHAMANAMPLPVDYQVPKVLHSAGALVYSSQLQAKIAEEVPIPSGSREEMEIRAAALVVVERLAARFDVSESVIDQWLWSARKRVPGKYHLTETTHY